MCAHNSHAPRQPSVSTTGLQWGGLDSEMILTFWWRLYKECVPELEAQRVEQRALRREHRLLERLKDIGLLQVAQRVLVVRPPAFRVSGLRICEPRARSL